MSQVLSDQGIQKGTREDSWMFLDPRKGIVYYIFYETHKHDGGKTFRNTRSLPIQFDSPVVSLSCLPYAPKGRYCDRPRIGSCCVISLDGQILLKNYCLHERAPFHADHQVDCENSDEFMPLLSVLDKPHHCEKKPCSRCKFLSDVKRMKDVHFVSVFHYCNRTIFLDSNGNIWEFYNNKNNKNSPIGSDVRVYQYNRFYDNNLLFSGDVAFSSVIAVSEKKTFALSRDGYVFKFVTEWDPCLDFGCRCEPRIIPRKTKKLPVENVVKISHLFNRLLILDSSGELYRFGTRKFRSVIDEHFGVEGKIPHKLDIYKLPESVEYLFAPDIEDFPDVEKEDFPKIEEASKCTEKVKTMHHAGQMTIVVLQNGEILFSDYQQNPNNRYPHLFELIGRYYQRPDVITRYSCGLNAIKDFSGCEILQASWKGMFFTRPGHPDSLVYFCDFSGDQIDLNTAIDTVCGSVNKSARNVTSY